jgi:hypothetical protein
VYEQPPGHRRIGPALIALLVVLGGGVGTGSYFVVRQMLASRSDQAQASGTTPPPRTSSTMRPAVPTPTGPQTTPKVTPKADDPGTSCPAITTKAVSDAGLDAQLKLLRYVDATLAGGSPAEAWICKNADGALFYQGHRKSGPFAAATSDDTILLGRGIVGKVDTEGDDGFVATNPKDPANPDAADRTEYHVSPKIFYFVVLPAGDRSDYTVTRTVG